MPVFFKDENIYFFPLTLKNQTSFIIVVRTVFEITLVKLVTFKYVYSRIIKCNVTFFKIGDK